MARKVRSDTVNTGIYVIEPKVIDAIAADRAVDWSQEVFPALLEQGRPIYGYVAKGYWCDIGTLTEYRRANTDLLNGLLNMGELGRRIGPGIWAGGAVDIDPSAELYGPIYLGDEVNIRSKVDNSRPGGHPRLYGDRRASPGGSRHHLAQLLHWSAHRDSRRSDRPPM